MMRLRNLLSSLNKPPLIAAAGAATAAAFPLVASTSAGTAGAFSLVLPLAVLQGLNVSAFALNCLAVSIPGRLDGQQDAEMRRGTLNPRKINDQQSSSSGVASSSTENSSLLNSNSTDSYSSSNGRALVFPSGWAFAIWGPIYLGETLFCATQFINPDVMTLLPAVTFPFVAANIFQSLWCAAFRPSYFQKADGWATWLSPCMLAGTAFSLSQVHHAAAASGLLQTSWFLIPLTMHFGWTTAAILVGLNGTVATSPNRSDRVVTAVGHGSALAATALGVGITLTQSSPVYGLSLAWALAACADGMNKRILSQQRSNDSSTLKTAARVQQKLCWAGAAACAAASVSLWIL